MSDRSRENERRDIEYTYPFATVATSTFPLADPFAPLAEEAMFAVWD